MEKQKKLVFEIIKFVVEVILLCMAGYTIWQGHLGLEEVNRQNLITQKSNLYNHAAQIHDVFIDKPQLKIPFYSDKIDSLDKINFTRLETVTELIADVLDQWASLDNKDHAYDGWPEYATGIYKKSLFFRTYINKNKDWYPVLCKFYTSKNL